MPENEETDKPDAKPPEPAGSKRDEDSLSYRLRIALHRRAPWLIEHPYTAESRTWHKARDPQENAETTPPADEYVDLRCLWAVEFYTPAHIENLLGCIHKLGWDADDRADGRNNPVAWIQRLRERPYGGGWLNLGVIRAPGSKSFFSHHRTAPLPAHVTYATGEIFSMTSSLTCIVIGFVFDDEYATQFDRALRTDRQTYLERKGRGHRVIQPDWQKRNHIGQIRAETRKLAASWLCEHLPGLFSSGLLEGESPTCEFVSLRKAEPFAPRHAGSDRPPQYVTILDMDSDFDVWGATDMPGLKFAWPMMRAEEGRYHSCLAVKEDQFDDDKLKSWGEPGRSAQINYVDDDIKGLLSRWAILPMLTGYGRSLNAVRDSAMLRPASRHDALKVLEGLGERVSYSVDIAAVTAGLVPFAKEPALFDHEVESFKPCNPRRAKDENYTIAQGLRHQIGEHAAWLQKTDRSLRDHMMQYGSLLGAKENVRLQRRLAFLTVVITVLTVLLLWDAATRSDLVATLISWLRNLLSSPM